MWGLRGFFSSSSSSSVSDEAEQFTQHTLVLYIVHIDAVHRLSAIHCNIFLLLKDDIKAGCYSY